MKILLAATTALALTGSAFAYQADDTAPATMTATVAIDPNAALAPPHMWTAEERALWDQHMAVHPAGWNADQIAAFEAMMAAPPATWTAQQRLLYEQHLATLPTTWTAEQRARYAQQIASLRTPWLAARQTASLAPGGQPELQTFAGMGGPYEEVYGSGAVSLMPRPADRNYPPCDPGPGDDHCIQLYERGVREQLASWNRPTGGLADGSATTAMGGPYEPADDKPAAPAEPDATEGGAKPDGTGDMTTHPDHQSTQSESPDPTGTTEDDTTKPNDY